MNIVDSYIDVERSELCIVDMYLSQSMQILLSHVPRSNAKIVLLTE